MRRSVGEGAAAQVPQGPGPEAALAILHELNRTACGGRCAVGSGGTSVGCAATTPAFCRRALCSSGGAWEMVA